MAEKIMPEFAELTGLSSGGKVPRRYLWTDAFAVCNFLGLYQRTLDEGYRKLALRLVDQVHQILGRHREDDPRMGWISGLSEAQGNLHPTKGGLRIGKEMNERGPDDPYDERLEWDRDGQYYHYLSKWMHALNCVSRVTGNATFNTLAIEMAKAVHGRFTYVASSGGQKRMFWKMSIDLSRPLVTSMGHHDPLDGFITYSQIQATAVHYAENATCPDLSMEIDDMARICEGKSWATDDPLGLGGLLCDACRVGQMIRKKNFEQTALLETLLDACLKGFQSYARNNTLTFPAEYRLAFRELGLFIGLRAIHKLQKLIEENPECFNRKRQLQLLIEALMKYAPLIELIEDFWTDPANRDGISWTEHRDINMVMLATSLASDGYLVI